MDGGLEEFDVSVLEAVEVVCDVQAERTTWGVWRNVGAFALNEEVYAVAKDRGVPGGGRAILPALLRMRDLGLVQQASGENDGRTCHLSRHWQVTVRGDRLLELVDGGAFFAEAMAALDAELVAG